MTIKQCQQIFKECNAEFIKANHNDIIMLNEVYSQFLDTLCKDGEITQKQYDRAGNLFYRRKK